jgi:hypothetical protein
MAAKGIKPPKGVEVFGFSIDLSQPEDTDGRINETGQDLHVEWYGIPDAGMYPVIRTERWAFDDCEGIAGLAAYLKAIEKAMLEGGK